MSDTPLTDRVQDECDVASARTTGDPWPEMFRTMVDHAKDMERDRSVLLEALHFYAGANAKTWVNDGGYRARHAIIQAGDDGREDRL